VSKSYFQNALKGRFLSIQFILNKVPNFPEVTVSLVARIRKRYSKLNLSGVSEDPAASNIRADRGNSSFFQIDGELPPD